MNFLLAEHIGLFADTPTAVESMKAYVVPTLRMFTLLASVACSFFIAYGGYMYMTSAGKPDSVMHAKRVMRNALIGLTIIIAATVIVSLLSHAYGLPAAGRTANLPSLSSITPAAPSNGLVEVLINAVIGFLNAIIQAIAAPFLQALSYFTTSTPLLVGNPGVFNLWLAIVGITDVLIVVVVALIGFHVMSAATFGFDEIELKHLLPRIALIFLLINTSIFLIDGIIELSNVLISDLDQVTGGGAVWDTLTKVVQESSSQGLAALLLMLAFLVFSIILLIYYVGRLVTLYIGAVLSPLVLLVWLIPGFRDFSETAAKTYITTIFVLFVHVVILQLASTLFTGMSLSEHGDIPNVLMSMVVGLATIIALLKTQGVMVQFSYVSGGARNTRKLSGHFMNGISHMTNGSKRVVSATRTTAKSAVRGIGMPGDQPKGATTSYITRPNLAPPRPDTSGVKVTRKPSPSSAADSALSSSPRQSPPIKAAVPKSSQQERVV